MSEPQVNDDQEVTEDDDEGEVDDDGGEQKQSANHSSRILVEVPVEVRQHLDYHLYHLQN